MWHDDEGDEDVGSGERPDPSTRHWRHPSELSQQGALPQPTPIPVTATKAGSIPTVWPLVAVGGCLAIAALGVIGLRTDLGRSDSLQAGSTATVLPSPTTQRTAAASSVETVTSTASTRRQGDADLADDGGDLSAWPYPTTSLVAPAQPSQTSAPNIADGPGTPSSDLLEATPPPAVAKAPVYGVYAAPGHDNGQLGSFLMVDDAPVTSASSLGDRTTVWLRAESDWLEAVVVALDPITDVALLNIVSDADGVTLPILAVGGERLGIGAPAIVGYGDHDLTVPLDDDTGAGEARRSWSERVEDGDQPVDDPSDPPGPVDGSDPSIPHDADDDDDGVAPDQETKAWVDANDRRGVVYSLTKPLATGSGRLIHDPIRLTTTPGPGDAGAPLRNRDGEIIGLVVDGPITQVAAVPIDRVIEAVGWLRTIGVGDPAWLGLTVALQPDGVVVTAVDVGGPAADLAPGDRIIAVDGEPIIHPDSLAFLARRTGPGQVLELTIERRNRRLTVPVEVATIPRT